MYIYYTALLCDVKRSVHFHGPSQLLVVNYFLIMTAVEESGVIHVSYHSTSSPVTYQPQRTWLLSDVNVLGGLFLCSSTLRMVIVERHSV